MIYDNLTVFRESYELLIQCFYISSNLNRNYRYSVGERLKNEIIEIELDIYKANTNSSKVKKIEYISSAIERVVVIKLLLRLLKDTKQIGNKQYGLAAIRIVEVSKQLSAWKSYYQEK